MKHAYWRVRFIIRQWYSFACKMAENFTTSSEPAKQKRVRGRPRKHPREEDLEVRVEGKELALRTTRKDYRSEASEVIFSLSVPNQLLFQWHASDGPWTEGLYIPLLNSSIEGCSDTVRLQPGDRQSSLSCWLFEKPGFHCHLRKEEAIIGEIRSRSCLSWQHSVTTAFTGGGWQPSHRTGWYTCIHLCYLLLYIVMSITAPQAESSDWSAGDNYIPSSKYQV